MLKKISNNFIKELISEADIVDIISRFVSLKKSGKSFKGCCPFHNEKTPSFLVTPDKNFFYCFGCQEAGDALTFIKKMNHLEFIEAVKYLAEIVGKPIEYEKFSEEDREKEKHYNKCINFLKIAQKYYRWNLGKSDTKKEAIQYLKKRWVNSDIAKIFGIGYSSYGWDNIIHVAKNIGVRNDILIETGLVITNNKNNVYDRFRGRIMFPIRNIQGDVIAYGGRVINDGNEVKYINSPETLFFQKKKTLYGLYEYREIRKKHKVSDSLVVVEGYMDVVGLASQGFYEAVATLGTSFSENHAKILFREISSIILCFDGDSAGKKAVIKATKIILPLLNANKKLKILSLTDNKDPDDYIKKYGLDSFKKALKESNPVAEFLVENFIGNRNLLKAQSKIEILENLNFFLQEVEDNIYSESIIATIAEKINIKADQIRYLLTPKKKVNLTDMYKVLEPGFKQQKVSNNLLLEEKLLAEIFVNPLRVKNLQEKYNFEILPTSQKLSILAKSLKILKEDTFNDIQVVGLIHLLCEKYSNYREYFFELLSYGINNPIKYVEENSNNNQILIDFRRIEKKSRREHFKYLGKLPFRTEIEEIEYKNLLVNLSN